jgi:hypothetical protein
MRISVATAATLVFWISAGCAGKTAPPSKLQAQRNTSPEVQAAARMTPDQLDAAMKSTNTANDALGMKLTQGDLAGAAKDAQSIASGFAEIERFFAQIGKNDAVELAKKARKGASEVAAAASAGHATKATSERAKLNATCKQCHDSYREGNAQTGYRLKDGVS